MRPVPLGGLVAQEGGCIFLEFQQGIKDPSSLQKKPARTVLLTENRQPLSRHIPTDSVYDQGCHQRVRYHREACRRCSCSPEGHESDRRLQDPPERRGLCSKTARVSPLHCRPLKEGGVREGRPYGRRLGRGHGQSGRCNR